MRVLCVEDDAAVAQSIELMMKSEGFNIYMTDLGEEAVDLAKLYDYDVITLDLTLPDMDGFEALRRIRAAGVKTPILILTALSSIECKVKAIGMGADDYLTKPFHKDELVARLLGLVRRSRGVVVSQIVTGNITLDISAKTVAVDGVNLPLTGKEYAMFELLSLRKGMTLTKEMFLNHIYGGLDEPEAKIIDVFICKIRKKMKRVNAHPIETVWGRGYVLRDAPGGGHVSMTSEVADFAESPPTGYVSVSTVGEKKAAYLRNARKSAPAGDVKSCL